MSKKTGKVGAQAPKVEQKVDNSKVTSEQMENLTGMSPEQMAAHVAGLDPNHRMDLITVMHETLRKDPMAASHTGMPQETVNSIRNYIQEGHTKRETCNRFTIKLDTLNRVMRENDIKPFHTEKINKSANQPISEETVNLVCNLFENTMTSLQDICKEAKIEYWEMQKILKDNFSQYDIDRRKSKMYAKSKMGSNNPMKGKCKENHHNYKA